MAAHPLIVVYSSESDDVLVSLNPRYEARRTRLSKGTHRFTSADLRTLAEQAERAADTLDEAGDSE